MQLNGEPLDFTTQDRLVEKEQIAHRDPKGAVVASLRQIIGRALRRISVVPFVILGMGTFPCQSQNFEIGRIAVCTNKIRAKTDPCTELVGPFNKLDRRAFPNKRIDFKLIIVGQRHTLDYLLNYGHLPVNAAVWRDGIRRDDETPIGPDQRDWDAEGHQLINQVAEVGQFTWRTFFYVNLNNANSVRIEINNALNLTALSGGNPARLSFTFAN